MARLCGSLQGGSDARGPGAGPVVTTAPLASSVERAGEQAGPSVEGGRVAVPAQVLFLSFLFL